jgi:hypothetical protein
MPYFGPGGEVRLTRVLHGQDLRVQVAVDGFESE